ncbi:MAG: hypothetical protein INR65_09225 [Gluconacetobacter diazotrophicus]|nr:hypothetical protein [Gluconacetobacter diazotrophicus]
MSRTLPVRCDVDIEQTPRSFHAHAVPDGVSIRPGDSVLVHGIPTAIGFGEHLVTECRGTVRRAGILRRAWTRATAILHLTELYEVGFEPHAPGASIPGQGRPA